jgi:pSer/pThr/pTyr-binding forkhead associated (FHA) protein
MPGKQTTRPDKKPTTKPLGVSKSTKPAPDATRPPRTHTLPDAMRGAWTQGPDTVTALAVHGEDRTYDLPRAQARITVGSQNDQDVVLISPYVSRKHCEIHRRGLRTYVVDVGSKNGIIVDGRIESEFEIKPGGHFTLGGGLDVVAINDAMREQIPVAAQIVCRESERHERGSQERPGPLDVLAMAISNSPILVTGETGLDHERLARALHVMSARRVHDLVTLTAPPAERKGQRAIIDAASRSTLILAIGSEMPVLDPAFADMLFDRSFNVRVITLAPTPERAAAVVGDKHVRAMSAIDLRPIAFRASAILWLVDEALRERGAPFRTSDLTSPNQQALENSDWTRNFDEVRDVADWLITLDKLGSVRAAAEALNVRPSTFHDWIADLGLSVPVRSARSPAKR